MIHRLSVVMAVLACAPAQAADRLSSSYWEAAYLSSSSEETADGSPSSEDDTEGFRLAASIGLLPYLNFIGDYDQRRFANGRDSFYSAGLAAHTLNPAYQFFAAATYERFDVDDNLNVANDQTQDGYGVQAGARATLTNLELHASYKYLDLGKVDDTTELTGSRYGAGFVLDLSPWWSLVGDYAIRTHEFEDGAPAASPATVEHEYSEWTVGFRRYLVTQTDRRKRTGGVLADLFSESGGE